MVAWWGMNRTAIKKIMHSESKSKGKSVRNMNKKHHKIYNLFSYVLILRCYRHMEGFGDKTL